MNGSPIDWRGLCRHLYTRQVTEHDVQCLDCGVISA